MPAEPSTKATAWAIFDRIVADAAPAGVHSNPWLQTLDGALSYVPDFRVLRKLLGVPLYLGAPSTTGVPALALDVWLSYELRRPGSIPTRHGRGRSNHGSCRRRSSIYSTAYRRKSAS